MATLPLIYPLYLKPLMVERIWGGNKLGELFCKEIPQGKIIGESWELTDRPEAESLVTNGHFAGKTIRYVLEHHAEAVLGKTFAAATPSRFPLLIKYIDSETPLSVQVHPDDDDAKALNDRGKSECWVILQADENASIVRGLKAGVTKPEYEAAVATGRVEDVLRSFTPKVGDVIALPPGMIHAIGAGIVLAEIQQNSDITFRVYDYNRLGLDGKPRKLHVEEALQTIRFEDTGDEFEGDLTQDTMPPLSVHQSGNLTIEKLLKGHFFELERHTLAANGNETLHATPDAPRVLMAVSGKGHLAGEPLAAGQTVLLPAALPDVQVAADEQENLVMLISTPTHKAF
jgi:mannose-6-phosphate isomerase